MVEIQIANVVGTISYQQELDLAALADTFENREEIASVTFEPAVNHWLQTRFETDNTYVAFYRSGRCSIAGCRSIDHFESIVERVNGVMRDLLEFEYVPEAKVNNIVATADLGSSIPLERVALKLGLERTEYEPEQFPAAIYRDGEYVMLIFSSGKVLCTGLADAKAVSQTIDDLSNQILPAA